ncbi:MAG TPA: glycosyltransferase [Fimbriimonadaceae bacterium]|nr:glycosyltransferase [Fimbriimonadaceae bacterium]
MLPITLCLIVRNDAERLRRCLTSCRNLFERVLVVDTGSTDRSREVAREQGAEVHEMEWPEAFDLARNFAFDLVASPWTMYLDSDEWLADDAPAKLERAVSRTDALGYFLLRRNLYSEGVFDQMRDLRLWRTHPLMRHRGVCHAQIPPEALEQAAEGRKLYDSDIAIWHDGYLGGISADKHERGIRLMRRELELRPGQLYYEIELARTLCLVGDPDGPPMINRLADRLLAMESLDEPPVPLAAALLASELDLVGDEHLRDPRTDRLLRLLRGWFPDSPVAANAAAKLHLRRGELPQALRVMLEMERMAEGGRYDRTLAFNPIVLQEALWTNLALVAHQLGRKDVARRNYERLLARDPAHPVASQNIRLL